MNKIDKMLNFVDDRWNDINDRLFKLVQADRITSGAYYLYNLYDNFHYNWNRETMSKAVKAKRMTRYINNNVSLWDVDYHLARLNEDLERVIAFVEDQEALPFEQTQKQALVISGQLKVMG